MFFLTPRYLKQAKLLHKGVNRFLDYKRDLLSKEKLAEIIQQRTELEQAMKARDPKRLEELSKELNKTCERALPNSRTSEWAENVEVIFVSLVIALGIRTYIAQPFQIPTASMQPTLNGIIADGSEKAAKEAEEAGLFTKAMGFFSGTTYVNVVSDHSGELASGEFLTEHKFLIFRPYSLLHFKDGHTIKINCPNDHLINYLRLDENLQAKVVEQGNNTPDRKHQLGLRGGSYVEKGQLIARGQVRNGDHVLVNKFAYHFRKPTRGEVFVFTTKNIAAIENERVGGVLRMAPEMGSQHYIKRLIGLPGDTIGLDAPSVLINGKAPTEPGIRRVIDEAKPLMPGQEPYDYHGYTNDRRIKIPVTLLTDPKNGEYFAMGDNSARSSDSRYFGPVPQQNLVGPGWFCYWPLTKHWGRIK